MDEDQVTKMSKTGMLIVTGCSFFLFSYMMKILDGNPSRFFLIGGLALLGLGIVNWIAQTVMEVQSIRKKRNNKNNVSSSY